MNHKTVITFFLIGITLGFSDQLPFIAGSDSNSYFNFNSDEYEISKIDITYELEGYGASVHKTYTIELHGRVYYYNGQKIDPALISGLAESFTDFYQSSKYEYGYEDFIVFDHYPEFIIEITYKNRDNMILRTNSSYHCFIPWNIEYKGKSYVQYNGKIPTALLKILVAIDKEEWSSRDKLSRWGCYPAPVPDRYAARGVSSDFPESTTTPTVKEEKGKQHVMWEINVQDQIIGNPVYADGKVYVITQHGFSCIDSKTGKSLWEITCEDVVSLCEDVVSMYFFYMHTYENLIVHEGMLYGAALDSFVYSMDDETGEILWKFDTKWVSPSRLQIYEDRLLVFSEGIFCLNKKTGEKIWEIPGNIYGEKVYDDKILFEGWIKNVGSYAALADITTGRIIWKEHESDISHLVYCEGTFYLTKWKEEVLHSVDLGSMEEIWSYKCGGASYFEVIHDRIVLLVSDKEKDYLKKVVLLDEKGTILWEYHYPEMCIRWGLGHRIDIEMVKDKIFLLIEGGVIQTFHVETGEILWETEMRGTVIMNFDMYKNRIYVFLNDGRIYCLRVETGVILWEFATKEELFFMFYYREPHAYSSEMKDNLLFVATKDGILFAFSRYPLFLKVHPFKNHYNVTGYNYTASTTIYQIPEYVPASTTSGSFPQNTKMILASWLNPLFWVYPKYTPCLERLSCALPPVADST